eukprot:scaffold672160_cov42-Prasinocladus_malaysianus.AAC.1
MLWAALTACRLVWLSRSGVNPLVSWVFDLVQDWFELAVLVFVHPKVPDVLPELAKDGVGFQLAVPDSQAGEVLWLPEDLRPAKHPRQHELHEDARGEPSEVSVGHVVASQVGPHHLGLQPVQLLPDLSQLGCPRGPVDHPRWRTVLAWVRTQ